MPRGKLTNVDEFAILDGIYNRIPFKYLAELLEVSEHAVRARAKKLEGTEKQRVFLAYREPYSRYTDQLCNYLFEDSGTEPKPPDDSVTGIDKVVEVFNISRKSIKFTEYYLSELAEKCVFEYRDIRKPA